MPHCHRGLMKLYLVGWPNDFLNESLRTFVGPIHKARETAQICNTRMASVRKAVSGSVFERIIGQMNVSRKILSPFKVKVTVPGGFPYEAYNGKGFIRPASLIRMVECSRSAALNKTSEDSESFLDLATLYKDYLVFTASTTMNIKPELYEMNIVKGPVELEVKLDYVGKSSYKVKTTISFPDVTLPVCESDTQFVFVSNQTRMPAAPPNWWQEKYSLSTENGKPLKLPKLIIPKDVEFSECQREVQESDVSAHMHFNWSNSIMYCHDAFVHSEFEKNGQSEAELAIQNMKYFSISYFNEASVGDILNVQFWKDDSKSNLFHFQLKKASDVISECSVEFF